MILIKNLDFIATFNDNEQVIKSGNILIDGREIRNIGPVSDLDLHLDEVIDGRGKIALPGFINTHHHFFQQLTRAVPAVHNTNVLEWLQYLYPVWGRMDEEAIYYASLLSCAELLLTGCTTTSDMAYFYPYGRTNLFDVEIKAASEIGIRFHPCRASMPFMEANLSKILEEQGIKSKQLTEEPDLILSECERVIKKYHQQEKFSMCRVAIGQTDKTYIQPEFMRQMADLARQSGVMLHTHLHPRLDEIALCKKMYNIEPIDFLEEHGWLEEDVWFAHATSFSPYYIEKVSKSKTGISHSPSSNMRLNYAFAPIPALIHAGVKVSVGVDGGSSNDSGDYLGELREVLLIHRIRGLHREPFNNALNTIPYDVLKLGTRGGADVLNRTDIGSLEVGKAADIALFNIDRIDFAGSHDPLAALLFCGINHTVDTTIVNGKVVVRNSKLVLKDETEISRGANKAAKGLFK
jgi:cytosine/adenosine deaminase-related metal-dependent hydrolase